MARCVLSGASVAGETYDVYRDEEEVNVACVATAESKYHRNVPDAARSGMNRPTRKAIP